MEIRKFTANGDSGGYTADSCAIDGKGRQPKKKPIIIKADNSYIRDYLPLNFYMNNKIISELRYLHQRKRAS